MNQQAFADEYIANKGNATQAYFKAYPNVTKETTANSNGSRMLRVAKVADYIADRTKDILERQKMTGDEIIIELVSIARREPKTSAFEEYDHLVEDVVEKTTRTFQPSVEEANKALETLVKWAGLDKPNNDLIRENLRLKNKALEMELEPDIEQDDKLMDFANKLDEVFKDE